MLVRWVRDGHEVEVADGVRRPGDEGGVGAHGRSDLAGDVQRVELWEPVDQVVEPGGQRVVGGAP